MTIDELEAELWAAKAELAKLKADPSACAFGMRRERERVVAWLRDKRRDSWLARELERGAHWLRKEGT